MKAETLWLLHFCLESKLLKQGQVDGLLANLNPGTEVESCVKMLTQAGWVTDKAFLKEAQAIAKDNAANGFKPPIEANGSPSASAQNSNGSYAVEVFAEISLPDYETLSTMSEDALLEVMRTLIRDCQSIGASDLHIMSGARPIARYNKEIKYLNAQPMPDSIARGLNFSVMPKAKREIYDAENDLNYGLTLEQTDSGMSQRFRANIFEHMGGISGTYRIILPGVKSLEELGFPNADVMRKLLSYHNGLVLVTGPSGNGKTTTLASMVRELNLTRREHIISIEDPIEVMQDSEKSIISQREVGRDTQSFQAALRSALREDPDIIVVGELRNLDTIEMALTAAETGHLVIATLDTGDAATTLNRILDVFPASQQNQIRAMAAGTLRGIVCQRLVPSIKGNLVLACELLVNTPAVANIIRDAKETGLESAMQTGRKLGMRTLSESLTQLVDEQVISKEVADASLSSMVD